MVTTYFCVCVCVCVGVETKKQRRKHVGITEDRTHNSRTVNCRYIHPPPAPNPVLRPSKSPQKLQAFCLLDSAPEGLPAGASNLGYCTNYLCPRIFEFGTYHTSI